MVAETQQKIPRLLSQRILDMVIISENTDTHMHTAESYLTICQFMAAITSCIARTQVWHLQIGISLGLEV